MKNWITLAFAVIALVQFTTAQSSADKAKLPYEPEQISEYIYGFSVGSLEDKKFIESSSNDLLIPLSKNYKTITAYKAALIDWILNNPEKVEKFLIKRRNYQQGKL